MPIRSHGGARRSFGPSWTLHLTCLLLQPCILLSQPRMRTEFSSFWHSHYARVSITKAIQIMMLPTSPCSNGEELAALHSWSYLRRVNLLGRRFQPCSQSGGVIELLHEPYRIESIRPHRRTNRHPDWAATEARATWMWQSKTSCYDQRAPPWLGVRDVTDRDRMWHDTERRWLFGVLTIYKSNP